MNQDEGADGVMPVLGTPIPISADDAEARLHANPELLARIEDAEAHPERRVPRSARGMYWNYRVVLEEADAGEGYVEVCEVYYDAHDEPTGYVSRAPGGESAAEVEVTLAAMREAVTKSVIEVVDGRLRDSGRLLRDETGRGRRRWQSLDAPSSYPVSAARPSRCPDDEVMDPPG